MDSHEFWSEVASHAGVWIETLPEDLPMIAILMVCFVGSGEWSWGGFAGKYADPPSATIAAHSPKSEPKNNAARSADCCCPTDACRCDSPCKCAAPKVEQKSVAVPEKSVAPPPQAPVVPETPKDFRATDDYGTTWQFDNKEQLDDWISAINASKKAREANARVQTQAQVQSPAQPLSQAPIQAPQCQPQFGYSMPQGQMYGGGMMGGGCASGQCGR